MKHFLLLATFMISCQLFAQDSTITVVKDSAYWANLKVNDFPDEDAEFPGGFVEMHKFINENLFVDSLIIGNQDFGKVFVGFVIDADGEVGNVRVIKSSSSPTFDNAVVAMISKMPRWIPGKAGGKAIAIRAALPIYVHLN